MTYLTDTDLADMRAAQADAMPDTFTVIHRTTAADGAGGTTVSGCTTSTYTGRIREARGDERPDPARVTEFSRYKLTLQHDAAISASDTVLDSAGASYRVLFVDDKKSWKTALRCDVELLRSRS